MEFQGYAHFGSSQSGWMNKRIFVHWALCFLSDILHYKIKLPAHLRKQRILLILDGHKSRANFFVAKLFDLFGIDILILPGHTSHLLQPFDVSLASSLKTEYKKQIENYDKVLDKNGLLKDDGKYDMGKIRKMMIICLINALKRAGTPSVIKSGFRASGIFPLNREIPLSSEYAMDVTEDIYNDDVQEKVNNKCLNCAKENLADVFRLDFQKEPTDQDFEICFWEIMMKVLQLYDTASSGWALTEVEDLLFESEDGSILRLVIDFH